MTSHFITGANCAVILLIVKQHCNQHNQVKLDLSLLCQHFNVTFSPRLAVVVQPRRLLTNVRAKRTPSRNKCRLSALLCTPTSLRGRFHVRGAGRARFTWKWSLAPIGCLSCSACWHPRRPCLSLTSRLGQGKHTCGGKRVPDGSTVHQRNSVQHLGRCFCVKSGGVGSCGQAPVSRRDPITVFLRNNCCKMPSLWLTGPVLQRLGGPSVAAKWMSRGEGSHLIAPH